MRADRKYRLCELCNHFCSDHKNGKSCRLCACLEFVFTEIDKPRRSTPTKLTSQQLKELKELLDDGFCYAEVSRRTGIKAETIRNRFHGYGENTKGVKTNKQLTKDIWERVDYAYDKQREFNKNLREEQIERNRENSRKRWGS